MKLKTEIPIAMIGSNRGAMREINSFLREENILVNAVFTIEESMSLFSKDIPHTVLLCFESIYEAQNYLLTLYRSFGKEHINIHEFILLCVKSEAKEAVKMIFNDIINDYFICKPIYDPNRLFVLIHNSMERQKIRLKLDRYRRNHNEALALHQKAKHVFKKTIEAGGCLQNISQESILLLKKVIDEKLSDFAQDMTGNKYKKAVQVVDKVKLNEYFDDFKTLQLGEEIDKYRSSIDLSMKNTLGEMQHVFEQYDDEIREHSVQTNQQSTILVVDDEPSNRKLLRKILQAKGFNVEEVEDGLQAVNFTLKNQTDLILMDIMMPNLDGFAASKLIRQNNQTKSIPIILITAAPSTEYVETCKKLGIKDFIVKPIKADTLLKKVSNCLQGQANL